MNLNGIDVAALNRLVKDVSEEARDNAEKGTAAFKVKTERKGQTKTVSTVSAYALNGTEIKRDFEVHADEPPELRGFLGLDPAIKPGYEEVKYTVRIRSDAPREKLEALHQRARRA